MQDQLLRAKFQFFQDKIYNNNNNRKIKIYLLLFVVGFKIIVDYVKSYKPVVITNFKRDKI